MAKTVKEPACQCRRHRFNPWVGKIWRREWFLTPVFLVENSMDRRAWGAVHRITKDSDTTE